MTKPKAKAAKAKAKTVTTAELLNRDGVIAWFDDFGGDQHWACFSNFYMGETLVLPITWGDVWTGEADRLWLEVVAEIDVDELIEGSNGESVFAAFKAARVEDFVAILRAKNSRGEEDPGMAKAKGRKCVLRDDWESVKYDVMMMVLRTKFQLGRPEADRLLESGDNLLIEGTYWGDKVWGVDLGRHDINPLQARGRNWLGTMLMARRAELKAQQIAGVYHDTVMGNAIFSA